MTKTVTVLLYLYLIIIILIKNMTGGETFQPVGYIAWKRMYCKENVKTFVVTGKEIGVEVNAEKS